MPLAIPWDIGAEIPDPSTMAGGLAIRIFDPLRAPERRLDSDLACLSRCPGAP